MRADPMLRTNVHDQLAAAEREARNYAPDLPDAYDDPEDDE